jgi:hypothetical protein
LDDGILSTKQYPVGYYATNPADPGGPDEAQWPEPPGMAQADTRTMKDGPGMGVDITQFTAYSANDSFQTYLMFRPTNGVWIAMAEYDWSWSASASAPWPAQNPQSAPAGNNAPQPSGYGAFPGWTNSTSQITWH